MLSEQKIKKLVEQFILEKGHFIVDVKISPMNKIMVAVDNDKGISISDCIDISRHIEANLNRDEEDFELEVSSPGLDQPFKVFNQYQKNLGKQIQTVTKEGQKVIGKLISVIENGIELEERLMKKTEGKKGKQLIINNQFIPFDQIKETKVVISFN